MSSLTKHLFQMQLWIEEILSIGTTFSTNLHLKRKVYKINFISLILQLLSYLSSIFYFLLGYNIEGIFALSIGLTLVITFVFNNLEYFDVSRFCVVLMCSLVCYIFSVSWGKYSGLHYIVLLVFSFPFVLFDIGRNVLIGLVIFNVFLFVFFQYEISAQKIFFSGVLEITHKIKFIPIALFMFTMLLVNMYLLSSENEIEEKSLLEAKDKFEKQISEAKSVIQNSEYKDPSNTIAEVLSLHFKELKESELRMQKLNFYLQRKNRDLDHFIYIASHDLKTPMSNIEGLIMALNNHPEYMGNKEFQEIIAQMLTCSESFKETISKLTEKSNYMVSEEREEMVDFEEVLKEVIKEIQIIISITNASIYYDFSEYRSIVYSRKNLQHILFNLITNSLKFKSPDRSPKIVIRTTISESNKILLIVKDNGVGISESKKHEIESILFNPDDYNEIIGSGTHILKKMITEQMGQIEIETFENMGTELRIQFNIEKQS